jgi:uncharacterized membrane protein
MSEDHTSANDGPAAAEIIALAEQQIKSRRDDPPEPRRGSASVPLAILFGLIGLFLFIPGLSLEQKLFALMHGVCDQRHTLIFDDLTLPLCARDTGIYLGLSLTALISVVRGRGRAAAFPPWYIIVGLGLLVLAMAVDGVNSTAETIGAPTWYTPRNDLRLLTGMGFGIAMATLLFTGANHALWQDARLDQSLIGSWADLGVIIASLLVVALGLLTDLVWLAWPVALLSVSALAGTLFTAMLLLVALPMGMQQQARRAADLARPASFAMLLVFVFLVGLALGRFQLELMGLLPLVPMP